MKKETKDSSKYCIYSMTNMEGYFSVSNSGRAERVKPPTLEDCGVEPTN